MRPFSERSKLPRLYVLTGYSFSEETAPQTHSLKKKTVVPCHPVPAHSWLQNLHPQPFCFGTIGKHCLNYTKNSEWLNKVPRHCMVVVVWFRRFCPAGGFSTNDSHLHSVVSARRNCGYLRPAPKGSWEAALQWFSFLPFHLHLLPSLPLRILILKEKQVQPCDPAGTRKRAHCNTVSKILKDPSWSQIAGRTCLEDFVPEWNFFYQREIF